MAKSVLKAPYQSAGGQSQMIEAFVKWFREGQ